MVGRCALQVLFAVAVFLSALPALSSKRVTSIDGREVVTGHRAPARLRAAVASNTRKIRANATVNVSAGADLDAANNDYRRIQNAINAAGNGDTIILSGTFDFTTPFAAAAWALGNDNTASTGDDYSVYVPANLNDVTLTATSLGSATIQGPGDLAALDLEGFLYFDGGDNQSWTISNLQIFDFDLGIGMFFGAGGADAFNDTVIQNNIIRLPADLNPTVAPADPLQNIAIHYAFGTNQTISGNVIRINGASISDSGGGAFASEVGMQSNTSGGAIYDGLTLSSNVIEVLNAQAADPQVVLGIWENGHAHSSDIAVSNNDFLNNAAGNDPALNLQRAFRVTSHSGGATSVVYDLNEVAGANMGFQWLAGSDFTGNQAVVVNGNELTDCATGILVQSNGLAHVRSNSITGSGAGSGIHVVTGQLTGSGLFSEGVTGNQISGGTGDGLWIEAGAGAIAPIHDNDLSGNTGFGLRNESAPAIDAEINWWGNNLAAAVAAEVSGNADFDPWLASGTDVAGGATGFDGFSYATTSGTVTTLLGTSGADTASVLAGDPVTMSLGGETAFTALAQLLNFDIQLSDDDDTLTLGATGIPTVVDLGAGSDTLFGPGTGVTYNILGANSGNAAGVATSFTGVETIVGGSGADSFILGAAGSLGFVNGGLGADTLNNSAIPAAAILPSGPGSLDGFMGTASGLASGFDNVNLVAGDPADLSVAKSGPANADAGSQISYTIDVINAGPNAAIDVTLSDPLPAGTTFVSFTPPGGWSCVTPAVGANGTVTCTRALLAVGTDSFTLVVDAPLVAGNLTNTATVTSANEGIPGDESDSADTLLAGVADLAITKTGPSVVSTGELLTYTITVTNNGPLAATNVVVSDPLPAGVTFDSATPSQGSCSGTTTVTCNLGGLANGASATVGIAVTVDATAGPISNTATVTAAETDPTPANSSTSAAAVNGPNIPTMSEWSLLALALMLAALAMMKMR